jgi:hypothetical protein
MANTEDLIRQLAGTFNKEGYVFILSEVSSVKVDDRTCNVIPVEGKSEDEIEEVQISADDGDGLILFPKVGSQVIVCISTTGRAFISMFSDVDDIQLRDNKFGGLVKIKELQDNLDTLKQYISDLQIAVQQGLTAVGIGTSANGGTGATAFQAAMAGKIIDFKDMENSNVKHG